MSDKTTIRVAKSTRNKLALLGDKGESFDEILVRILK